ncbi:hypothetical protein [Spiroplasma sp. AdecLV25b]|uniref:hypothetical protein n=1 Tax=Spiroplasma sp. AdecLV25b TaxID=3027162 RepID=UPI0027DEE6E6|nr:hypothetical protein [Spiroplasma sp. AdecLV25b]
MIWKKWFSFIGIFILIFLAVFLTNNALNSRENVNNVFTSLNQSNMYKYNINAFRGMISDKGFQAIENHFFLATKLTKDQKDLISDNQIITSPDSDANDEIQKWNYNFRAWLINQFGKNNYQLAGQYSITNIATINGNNYRIRLENGFNDKNWTFVNHTGNIVNNFY